jgi:hypothetical protein
MRLFRCTKTLFLLVLVAMGLVWSMTALPYGVVYPSGNWPENWPKELEPFRERAQTVGYGVTVETEYYIIEFRTREEFETIWPALLRLKSKGAPLRLKTADKPSTDPNDPRVAHERPHVQIICPMRDKGRYQLLLDGTYRHIGPWAADLQMPNGILPERVVKRKKDGKWVVWEKEYPLIDLVTGTDYEGPAQQARVQLTLYVDGDVIDLNRIRIPDNTPIEDNRVLDKNNKTSSK